MSKTRKVIGKDNNVTDCLCLDELSIIKDFESRSNMKIGDAIERADKVRSWQARYSWSDQEVNNFITSLKDVTADNWPSAVNLLVGVNNCIMWDLVREGDMLGQKIRFVGNMVVKDRANKTFSSGLRCKNPNPKVVYGAACALKD